VKTCRGNVDNWVPTAQRNRDATFYPKIVYGTLNGIGGKRVNTDIFYRRAVGEGSLSTPLRESVPNPVSTRASAYGLAVNE
jgi:hypothetical protein